MTLTEIQDEILSYFNDPSGEWTTRTRITSALNLGQAELVHLLSPRALEDMCPKMMGGVSQVATVGVGSYTAPTDFVRPYSVTIDGYPARFVSWPNRGEADGSNTFTQALATSPAYTIYGLNYFVYPTPATTVTISFAYVHDPTALASGTDTTDFGIAFDEILIDLAVSTLLKKQGTALEGGDQDTLDHRQRALNSIAEINKRYA